jgi:hypothetical protein
MFVLPARARRLVGLFLAGSLGLTGLVVGGVDGRSSAQAASYEATVLAGQPNLFWRLNETSGTRVCQELCVSD